jgi:hypothetical protein
LREESLDAVENVQSDPFCSGGVVLGDVGAQRDEVVNGFRRPQARMCARTRRLWGGASV